MDTLKDPRPGDVPGPPDIPPGGGTARTHEDVLKDALKDPEFRKEYEAFGPEFREQRENITLKAIEGGRLTVDAAAELLGISTHDLCELAMARGIELGTTEEIHYSKRILGPANSNEKKFI